VLSEITHKESQLAGGFQAFSTQYREPSLQGSGVLLSPWPCSSCSGFCSSPCVWRRVAKELDIRCFREIPEGGIGGLPIAEVCLPPGLIWKLPFWGRKILVCQGSGAGHWPATLSSICPALVCTLTAQLTVLVALSGRPREPSGIPEAGAHKCLSASACAGCCNKVHRRV
jgi:hypothetical protein